MTVGVDVDRNASILPMSGRQAPAAARKGGGAGGSTGGEEGDGGAEGSAARDPGEGGRRHGGAEVGKHRCGGYEGCTGKSGLSCILHFSAKGKCRKAWC